MDRLRITIGLVLAAALLALGCTSSHWSSDPPSEAWPAGTPQPGQAAAYPATATPDAPGPLFPPVASQDPQALQDVIAEVHRLRALDPAAEKQLLENLRETPPDLWPLVVHQFRAALAFRSRAEHGPAAGRPPEASAKAAVPSAPTSCPVAGTPVPRATVAAKPASASHNPVPAEAFTQPPVEVEEPGREDSRVKAASYTDDGSDSGDWQRHLSGAVAALESKVSPTPEDADQIAEHARLRMLYLLAGRRDEALKPIPAVAAGTQDFWSNELYGLAALLDGASSASPSRLAAEAQRPLNEAVTRLAESCPLVLSNLAFVTEVQSYGVFERFEKYEFAPGQKLLLYAEVENFRSNETADGFHTALKSSYQIFDSGGRRVAEHAFATNEEDCRNRRRDFFIGYEFHLPQRIYSGRHVLKLTVEDVNSAKVGQSSIEFIVKAADD